MVRVFLMQVENTLKRRLRDSCIPLPYHAGIEGAKRQFHLRVSQNTLLPAPLSQQYCSLSWFLICMPNLGFIPYAEISWEWPGRPHHIGQYRQSVPWLGLLLGRSCYPIWFPSRPIWVLEESRENSKGSLRQRGCLSISAGQTSQIGQANFGTQWKRPAIA